MRIIKTLESPKIQPIPVNQYVIKILIPGCQEVNEIDQTIKIRKDIYEVDYLSVNEEFFDRIKNEKLCVFLPGESPLEIEYEKVLDKETAIFRYNLNCIGSIASNYKDNLDCIKQSSFLTNQEFRYKYLHFCSCEQGNKISNYESINNKKYIRDYYSSKRFSKGNQIFLCKNCFPLNTTSNLNKNKRRIEDNEDNNNDNKDDQDICQSLKEHLDKTKLNPVIYIPFFGSKDSLEFFKNKDMLLSSSYQSDIQSLFPENTNYNKITKYKLDNRLNVLETKNVDERLIKDPVFFYRINFLENLYKILNSDNKGGIVIAGGSIPKTYLVNKYGLKECDYDVYFIRSTLSRPEEIINHKFIISKIRLLTNWFINNKFYSILLPKKIKNKHTLTENERSFEITISGKVSINNNLVNIKVQFIFGLIYENIYDLLESFDLNCVKAAFIGNKQIVATDNFLTYLNTKEIINYMRLINYCDNYPCYRLYRTSKYDLFIDHKVFIRFKRPDFVTDFSIKCQEIMADFYRPRNNKKSHFSISMDKKESIEKGIEECLLNYTINMFIRRIIKSKDTIQLITINNEEI
jgi:hypothetical protein